MNFPFFTKSWNSITNDVEFLGRFCWYCKRFWGQSPVKPAQPICLLHTHFLTRIGEYAEEGKLWDSGEFEPIPKMCPVEDPK